MVTHTDRKTGILLLLVSALVFSTAGLFTKGVEAGAWEVIFWRGLFAAIFTTVYIFARGSVHYDFVEMGKWGWIVGIIGASGTAAFIPAFKLTSIANVSLIYAAAPLLAALFAWFWIREKPGWPTVSGCIVAFAGVSLIVSGSLETINLAGDLLALWMTIVIATIMVIYRKFADIPAAGPSVLMSVFLLPPALVLSNPFAISHYEIIILAAFGLVFAIASVALAEGAKRLPSGETALLSSLEAPFAIVLAMLILFETPPLITILGGTMVMTGVLGSQLVQTRTTKGETPCQPQES
ncbi:MAG: DMT family transporter [Pseudomonadota bacterium]